MFENIKAFVLDMDGTIYLGNELFPFTKDFLSRVEETGTKFYFFTNNSSKSQQAYIEKLSRACHSIRNGCIYYGINPDLNCPMEGGTFIPDCGSMARLVEASTGRYPEFFGKPSEHTLNYMIQETGYRPDEIAIVGDRLYTDIAVADQSEVTSILVLSGESTLKDVENGDVKPDVIVKDLSEITREL